jgi:hypothetical protein
MTVDNRFHSLISVFTVADTVYGERGFGFFEDDAVVANAKAEQAFQLAAERFHMANSGFGVAMNGLQDSNGGTLIDGADLSRHARLKAVFFTGVSCPETRGFDPW